MTEKKIGVISDTHGLLREGAKEALRGSDLIIHAGDVGSPAVLAELQQLGKVAAVRGNVDRGEWALQLPLTEYLELAGWNIYIIHDLQQLELDLPKAQVKLVIFGHSHQPVQREEKGVVYLNPGSAGPRRFKLPVSLAVLRLEGESLETEFINLG